MNAISIIVLIIGLIFFVIGLRKIRTANTWIHIAARQRKIIDTQKEIIDLKESAIQNYKRIMAQGLTIIPNEQQN